jgi:hypothetical protein
MAFVLAGGKRYVRNTPKRGSPIGAFSVADIKGR